MSKSDRTWIPDQTDLDWIETTARPPHAVLLEMEAVADPEGIPILNRDAGRMLAILVGDRRRVVEVGTAIGYSTLWMALALPDGGTIVTIDPDRERTDRARSSGGAPASRAGSSASSTPRRSRPSRRGRPSSRAPSTSHSSTRSRRSTPSTFVGSGRGSPRAPSSSPTTCCGAAGRPEPGRLVTGDGTDALREFCREMSSDTAFETTILPIGDGLLVAALRG